ncbi:MAG: ABC transporter substrate-binding protein [Burkholderiales bacterium]|nr:ABC transporter substrate-binding protein [Burkholderiales bacterium]
MRARPISAANFFTALAGLLLAGIARAALPTYYPAEYQTLVDGARREGKVVVYAATDLSAASPLIHDFETLFPGVRVDYRELNSAELYARYLGDIASNKPIADALWSPAMDLQMKLANDNRAASYRSPEAGYLPDWAVWRDMAYGTTFEPAVIVFNRRNVPPAEVPHSHAELMALLAARHDKYLGRVTTYDIEKSALGFLFATQDAHVMHDYWDLARQLGRSAVQFDPETAAMVERIASGRAYIGYNLIGSYAVARARHDPAIGVVMPGDYTLVMSRIVLLSKEAPHPNAARLWLDYLLSARGQNLLAGRAGMAALRKDVQGEASSAHLRDGLGGSMKAITVGPGLFVYRDQAKQAEFLRRWRRETQGAR